MRKSGGGNGLAGWGRVRNRSGGGGMGGVELCDDFQFQKRKDNADERKYRKFYAEHVLRGRQGIEDRQGGEL